MHKDLVVIPGPDIEKVPTQSSRVKLEERELVCHEFSFNKEWDEATLKNEILKQFPAMINFNFVKVRCNDDNMMIAFSKPDMTEKVILFLKIPGNLRLTVSV